MDTKKLQSAIVKAKKDGNFVFIIGNGGSACNSEHFAEDLLSKGVKALALTSIGNITAIANDYGYLYVFSRQLKILASSDDILITLSCSGTSKNILQAIKTAKIIGMKVISFPTNKQTKRNTPDTETIHQYIIHKIYQAL